MSETKGLSRRRLLVASGLGMAGSTLLSATQARAQEPFSGMPAREGSAADTGRPQASGKHLPRDGPAGTTRRWWCPTGRSCPGSWWTA
ncbi:hypothetical protein ACN28S_28435 [Cystobacter fuscus]